ALRVSISGLSEGPERAVLLPSFSRHCSVCTVSDKRLLLERSVRTVPTQPTVGAAVKEATGPVFQRQPRVRSPRVTLIPTCSWEEQVPVPVYHPTPSQTRLATQLTEEEQIRIAQRIGLIQHLPKGVYDPGRDGSEKKIRECVICMMDFVYGDPIRFLPCMHIYHLDCIDDWLMRSFTCPSCMEPVDAALLSSYETN
uniref:RING finger protein 11 n=1 Tax=Gallus gallus TaxID=9031 RepID=A0A8V1A0D9_CHICK